ncbi:hypothetical protein [Trueperella bialowiezensis]|uniref:AbiEi antitoxin C-terminal domain-containing protein n=1 Tax=Trueperella bialowiezensis TaxID=312285 RepID=A0A3S4VS11_9ACTO|nr:hypothetical protein [Trueperella bialowiezensis]VEI12474.1 Uncharacterised protein [Trueperella bialowiezensis]
MNVHQPATITERNAGHALLHERLMVEIGGIGLVGVDLCHSSTMRGGIIAMRHRDKIVRAEAALWIHTGLTSVRLANTVDVMKKADPVDVVTIGGQQLTSLERTALDLLIKDPESGIGYMGVLIRAGARLEKIKERAHALSLAGILRARSILNQLPANFAQIPPAQNP